LDLHRLLDLHERFAQVVLDQFKQPCGARASCSWTAPIYRRTVASAFRQMMRDDRERLGLCVARASWLLGVSVRSYRELEHGESYPSYGEWAKMVDVFQWPRSFA
jgi:hypothetical protein